MNYALAKQLKDAGFPQRGCLTFVSSDNGKTWDIWNDTDISEFQITKTIIGISCPTLSELIEACGDDLFNIHRYNGSYRNKWCINFFRKGDGDFFWSASGDTIENALISYWLAINKK